MSQFARDFKAKPPLVVAQRIEGFSNIKNARDEAKRFAAVNVKTLAIELIQWQDTGMLADGKLRELAAIWAAVDESNALSLAESTATRAALDSLA